MLPVSVLPARDKRGRTLGAIITSASGDNFRKAAWEGGAGDTEVMETFAVEVGDR